MGQELTVALEGSGLWARLALDAFGNDALRLEVALSGRVLEPISAQVFVCDHDEFVLLGAEPLGADRTATFRGIPPGRYLIDIHEQARHRRFRLRLVVQPSS
jgi:hypothetical protein